MTLTALALAACSMTNETINPVTQSNNAQWLVNPNGFQSIGFRDFPNRSFILTNSGSQDGQFEISSDADWLTATPSSGTLQAGAWQKITVAVSDCTIQGARQAVLSIAGTNAQQVSVRRYCKAVAPTP